MRTEDLEYPGNGPKVALLRSPLAGNVSSALGTCVPLLVLVIEVSTSLIQKSSPEVKANLISKTSGNSANSIGGKRMPLLGA
jgi:hypothetical protein